VTKGEVTFTFAGMVEQMRETWIELHEAITATMVAASSTPNPKVTVEFDTKAKILVDPKTGRFTRFSGDGPAIVRVYMDEKLVQKETGRSIIRWAVENTPSPKE